MVSEYALIIYIVSGIVSSAIILGFVLSSKRISKGGSDKTSLVISEVKGVSVIKQKEPQQIDIATKYLNIPFNGLLKFAVKNGKYKFMFPSDIINKFGDTFKGVWICTKIGSGAQWTVYKCGDVFCY
jgi:hypothetical protein